MGGGRGRRGITLLELLVVVIVIAILAAIALPNVSKTVEQGRKRQAQDILMAIYTGERSYYFYHNQQLYLTLDLNKSNLEWREIGMDDPNELGGNSSVTFDVAAGAGTFVATADRGGGKTITIDQDRQVTDSWTIP